MSDVYYLNHTAEELDAAIEKVQSGYKNVSHVTATEADVVIGKTIVTADGSTKNGTLNTNDFYNDGYSDGEVNGYNNGYNQGLEDATPRLQSKEVIPSTENQTIVADSGYDGLSQVTVNAMTQVSMGTPKISVDGKGLITVTLTQSAGYVKGGTTTTTHQLATHSGGTYDTEAQTISTTGKFMLGDIIIKSFGPTYTVSAISGASYGFTLNNSGYYESGNKGKNSSYAICRVNFDVPVATTVYFDCINYAEANYDFGILSNIDNALTLSSSADSSCAKSFKGSSSSNVQTVSYSMPVGTHFVDVKFIKDSSDAVGNDTLQFKVRFA